MKQVTNKNAIPTTKTDFPFGIMPAKCWDCGAWKLDIDMDGCQFDACSSCKSEVD